MSLLAQGWRDRHKTHCENRLIDGHIELKMDILINMITLNGKMNNIGYLTPYWSCANHFCRSLHDPVQLGNVIYVQMYGANLFRHFRHSDFLLDSIMREMSDWSKIIVQWYCIQSHKKNIIWDKKNRESCSRWYWMAATEPWSRHHQVILGSHEKTLKQTTLKPQNKFKCLKCFGQHCL